MHLVKKILSAAACAALLVAAPAHADKQVIKLGWATSDGATDPYAVGARSFKKAVEQTPAAASLDIQLYPNRQIGDERQLMEGLRFGTVDAAIITNAVVAQVEPAFQVLDLPFVFADEARAHKALDGAVGADLSKRLLAKNVVLLGYFEGGFRNLINNKRPVVQPADMKGVKLRVMQNPLYIDIFNSLGGSPVPMAWSETYTAVQQGTIDGLEMPVNNIEPLKVNEVTKYLSLTNHTYSTIALLVGKRTMDRLTPEQRQALVTAAAAAVTEQRKVAMDDQQKSLVTLEKAGMKINRIQEAAAFRKAVEPVYLKARQAGYGSLVDQLLASK
jgi:tripartite ATP-independent transporter DctP family solute receptor